MIQARSPNHGYCDGWLLLLMIMLEKYTASDGAESNPPNAMIGNRGMSMGRRTLHTAIANYQIRWKQRLISVAVAVAVVSHCLSFPSLLPTSANINISFHALCIVLFDVYY